MIYGKATDNLPVHGYSLLRPTLNVDYFHDLYDEAVNFGIEVEGHRQFNLLKEVYQARPDLLIDSGRY